MIISIDDIVFIDKLSAVGETYVVEWIYYNKLNIRMAILCPNTFYLAWMGNS